MTTTTSSPKGSSPKTVSPSAASPKTLPLKTIDVNTGSSNNVQNPVMVDTPVPDEEGSGGISKEINLDLKPRRYKKRDKSPGVHDVTFSVAIAIAFPMPQSSQNGGHEGGEESTYRGKHAADGSSKVPRGTPGYYHIEFRLFPDDKDIVKVDVVLSGTTSAKIFSQGDPKPVKVWNTGDELWVCWQHNFLTTVNQEFLKLITNHKLEIRVWDDQTKCSARARYEKMKNIHFPPPKPGQDPEDVGGVKGSVMRISRSYERRLASQPNRPLPHQSIVQRHKIGDENDELSDGKNVSHDFSLYKLPRPLRGQRTFSRLQRLAGPGSPDPDEAPHHSYPIGSNLHSVQTNQYNDDAMDELKKHGSRQGSASGGSLTTATLATTAAIPSTAGPVETRVATSADIQRQRAKKKEFDDAKYYYDQNGRVSLALNMTVLFARQTTIERLQEPDEGIEDMFVQLSLSDSLLSDIQKDELNPLLIHLRGASSLPSTPLSFTELQKTCEPVYCQYTFMNEKVHVTSAREHAEKIFWDDYKVILTGLMNKAEFEEFLRGPGLLVELHDRDRKPVEQKIQAALFGSDLEDEKISNIGTVTSKRTLHNVYGESLKPWDPFAITRCDLSGFLDGQRILVLQCPLGPCPLPDMLGNIPDGNGKIVGVPGAVDGPQSVPLHTGHYVESDAVLKVAFELSKPMVGLRSKSNVFGRIIFIFNYTNTSLLHTLKSIIKRINASGLGLSDLPDHAIATALTTKKLKLKQLHDAKINVISGFHVMDGLKHIFVLEAPQDQAILSLFQTIKKRDPDDDLVVIYNANVTFTSRIYGELSLDIAGIKLHNTVEGLISNSLLYVRDMLPKPCFQAISRIAELLKQPTMQTIVKSNLFPSSEMLASLTKELSVPLTVNDMYEMDATVAASAPVSAGSSDTRTSLKQQLQQQQQQQEKLLQNNHHHHTDFKYRNKTVENFNETYIRSKRERSEQTLPSQNFVKENISVVSIKSAKIREQRAKTSPVIKVHATTAYNYSGQRLNSTEAANAEIRAAISADPLRRCFTYMPQYHNSGTVSPVDKNENRNAENIKSQNQWRTKVGWVYPGWRSSSLANQHPLKLDQARLEEIHQIWQENVNHQGKLAPTLPNREIFPWNQRKEDMDIWRKPSGVVNKEPLSIHSTGVAKSEEEKEALIKESEEWQKRIVVSDLQFHVHRVLPSSELKHQGKGASNQVDKLYGLLKDYPSKTGLVFPGVQEIPALNVMYGKHDADTSLAKVFMPGSADLTESLKRNYLKRPEHGRGFNLYHRERSVTSHRSTIKTITDEERDTHLYQTIRQATTLSSKSETNLHFPSKLALTTECA